MNPKRRIGAFEIDLSRVRDFHYDEQGNLIIKFDENDDGTLTLNAADVPEFLAHWNEFCAAKSSPPLAS